MPHTSLDQTCRPLEKAWTGHLASVGGPECSAVNVAPAAFMLANSSLPNWGSQDHDAAIKAPVCSRPLQ